MDALLAPVEQFPTLAGLPCHHAFVGRVPGVGVTADRAAALARLESIHQQAQRDLGLGEHTRVTAEQVHGNKVGILRTDAPLPAGPLSGVDGLVTNRSDICLGIYVADCGAVYLVDPVRRVVGLVHSGRKGTELGIVQTAIAEMSQNFGCQPEDIVAQLGPCIRPPWYETDFAAQIVEQCRAAGITQVFDCGVCTAAHPDRYYSYRREKGRTGRMLAILGLN